MGKGAPRGKTLLRISDVRCACCMSIVDDCNVATKRLYTLPETTLNH